MPGTQTAYSAMLFGTIFGTERGGMGVGQGGCFAMMLGTRGTEREGLGVGEVGRGGSTSSLDDLARTPF
eukprot:770136-Rhodomonas_salina.1